jgi:hypothetical protein
MVGVVGSNPIAPTKVFNNLGHIPVAFFYDQKTPEAIGESQRPPTAGAWTDEQRLPAAGNAVYSDSHRRSRAELIYLVSNKVDAGNALPTPAGRS